MHKKVLTLAAIIAGAAGMNAQVQNYALQFGAQGVVDCGYMPSLNNANSYSVQFWINPTSWTEGAAIISNGDLNVKLGATGNIQFKVGESTLSAKSDDLKVGQWSQITLVNNNGNAKILVNGVEQATGTLAATSQAAENFTIGGGTFVGRIDELRIWNAALSSDFNYFINNTVNKWCPQWDNLIAYYKFDQNLCKDIVDYKEIYETTEREDTNHGKIDGSVTRVEVKDNLGLPYLVNAAYTENNRFFDRAIPLDQYLLSNDLIILGADVKATGHAVWRTPCNHATSNGAQYLASYQGRTGVASFDGKSTLVAPSTTLTPELDTNNVMSTGYTFEAWLFIDEWVEGAYIISKENADHTKGFSVRLGAEDTKQIIVTVDGNKFVNQNRMKVGEWVHLGIAPDDNTAVRTTFNFTVNGKGYTATSSASDKSTVYTFTGVDDEEVVFGENFKGKMDNVTLWDRKFTSAEIGSHSTTPLMPGIGKTVTAEVMRSGNALYTFDDPNNFGYSSYSQDEWKAIMLSAYEGYNQPTVRLSVNGDTASGTWMGVVKDSAKRKILAADLAELVKDYDGLELDFEWFYNNETSNWNQYGLLADEIVAALPAGKTFHISCHNVAYAFPTSKISEIDGFTFQQYGPQSTHFTWNTFVSKVSEFINYGYPKDKIVLSYATTTSNGSNGSAVTGVRNGLMDGDDFVPSESVDKAEYSGQTYYFCGPIQTYKRAKYCVDNNLQGIFYWDMGNDVPVEHKYNLAKYASYGLNSNIEKVVTSVNADHTATVVNTLFTQNDNAKLFITPNPAIDVVYLSSGSEQISEVSIYNLSGALVKKVALNGSTTVNVADLSQGHYVVKAAVESGATLVGKLIKK
jgi:hypothetical protein